MNHTPLFHRIGSTSFVLAAALACSAKLAAAETVIPPMPNACAETACVVIRASAELACTGTGADPDSCEIVLTELQRCFDQCPDSP